MVLETEENLTTIAVSRKNHLILSMLGKKGQSFDDVLTELLSVITQYPQDKIGQMKKSPANFLQVQTSQESDVDHK
jgi:hypothetical protein